MEEHSYKIPFNEVSSLNSYTYTPYSQKKKIHTSIPNPPLWTLTVSQQPIGTQNAPNQKHRHNVRSKIRFDNIHQGFLNHDANTLATPGHSTLP
jgi:hypothetical protein